MSVLWIDAYDFAEIYRFGSRFFREPCFAFFLFDGSVFLVEGEDVDDARNSALYSSYILLFSISFSGSVALFMDRLTPRSEASLRIGGL